MHIDVLYLICCQFQWNLIPLTFTLDKDEGQLFSLSGLTSHMVKVRIPVIIS